MKFKNLNKVQISLKIKQCQEEVKELEKEDFSALYNQDVAYHNYGYIHTFRVISDGLRLQNIKQFSAGLLAGIWIALAYIAALIASYSFKIDGTHVLNSFAKLTFSLVFSCVIILISFLGGGFVTAHMWYNRTMFKKVERWAVFLKACGLVYIGNIIGVLIVVIVFQLSGTMQNNADLWKYLFTDFIVGKLYGVGIALSTGGGISGITGSVAFETLLWTTMSAILCNFLICLATQGSKSTKGNTVATMIMYFIILFYFAIGGYQHCVANWYIAWMILTEYLVNHAYHLTNAGFDPNFSWIFLVFNIIPAIVGNFIGGWMIGWIMSMFNKEFDSLLIKEARLRFLKEELIRLENKQIYSKN